MATSTKREELKAICQRYASMYNHKADDLRVGLEYFALHLLAQREGYDYSVLDGSPTEQVDLSEFRPAGPNDLSIDGLLIDSQNRQVTIIQASYTGKADSNLLEKASTFLTKLPQWLDDDYVSTGNERVRTLLSDAELDPTVQNVSLYFVTSAAIGADPKFAAAASSAQEAYEQRGWSVECQILGAAEVQQLDDELRNAHSLSLIPRLEFMIGEGSDFVFNGPQRALVCAIKGNEISNMFHRPEVRNNLFNSNIRLSLTSGKINPEIQRTAQDPERGRNFFYYNNGITATCTSFDFVTENKVSVENIQVVNGAQTVNALARGLKKSPNADVYVLLRLIETQESYKKKSAFAEEITKFQNTQNSVKLSDFFSNDPFQLWLRDHLADSISGKGAGTTFYYVHKRGFKPPKAAGQALTLEELALLRHATLYGPTVSYGEPRSFWDSTSDAGRYWEAFGHDGEPCTIWSSEQLAQVSWAITTWRQLRELHQTMRKKNREGSNPTIEQGYLGYLARYITALAFEGVTHGVDAA